MNEQQDGQMEMELAPEGMNEESNQDLAKLGETAIEPAEEPNVNQNVEEYGESSNDTSSIIIDTKVNNEGIPVLTNEQKEEYLKRALGEEFDASKLQQSSSKVENLGQMNSRQLKNYNKQMQLQMQ